MLPVIAIVGRPNVGKSTLFNRLTKTQQALVADTPGVTRDRLYGQTTIDEQKVIVVDTGGLQKEKEGVAALITHQAWLAIEEANLILFVVDSKEGLTPSDQNIANELRKSGKSIIVVANKKDAALESAATEFFQLGLDAPVEISSAHGHGISELREAIQKKLINFSVTTESELPGIKIAVIGRPNVGKSTLINRILGEERVIVYDMPGTTRDSIYIPFQHDDKNYILIDTAGVRRRRGISEALEKFSVIKALQAIEASNVVVMVMDAAENITEQDLKLLGFILEAGKALVIVVNKWDNLSVSQRRLIKKEIDRRLNFVPFVRIHFISALHGSGVGDILNYVVEAHASANKDLSTSDLNRVLEKAVAATQPPSPGGHPIKLRYVHMGGHNPPLLIIHGKRVKKLPVSYRRYLSNYFRKAFKLVGTPLILALKEEND